MSAALDEVERRQARRVTAESSIAQMKQPTLMSDDAESTAATKRKELKKEYKDTLPMLTTDFKRLNWALKEVCRKAGLNPGEEFDAAVRACPIPSDVERAINEKAARDAEKAKDKDIPGQIKMDQPPKKGRGKYKDDGSTAEAAGECITKKIDEEGNVIEESSSSKDLVASEPSTSALKEANTEGEKTEPGKSSTTAKPTSEGSSDAQGKAQQEDTTKDSTLRLVPPNKKPSKKAVASRK